MSIIDGLAKCFGTCNKKQMENLLWHVEKETPICCGINATLYVKEGAG